MRKSEIEKEKCYFFSQKDRFFFFFFLCEKLGLL